MSSVITTLENDAKAVVNTVSTDLQSEVTRLTGLLAKAKTTITAQAQTIAGHVTAAASSSNVVSQAAATLKAASDDFEKVLSNAAVPVSAAVAAAVTIPLVVNTAQSVSQANVTLSAPAPTVNVAAPVAQAQTAPAPAANAVVVALDAALHASNVAPTVHNLLALEEAYARLMANAGQSNSAAVPLPPQVAAIVQAAQTTSSGVLNRIETGAEEAATAVKTEVENLGSEVKTAVEDVAEGKVTIGPLHI